MILGLTGAIGSGKSAVLAVFASRNWLTVDADKLCHAVYDNAADEFTAKLNDLLGESCVDDSGKIDRSIIARAVFKNKSLLEKLESLVIPEFEKQFTGFISDCRIRHINAVCEIPLLFERGYQKYFDAVVGIWTPDNLRRDRLKNLRNMNFDDIMQRELNQWSAEKKVELSDYCIVNDGRIDDIGRQVDLLLHTIMKN